LIVQTLDIHPLYFDLTLIPQGGLRGRNIISHEDPGLHTLHFLLLLDDLARDFIICDLDTCLHISDDKKYLVWRISVGVLVVHRGGLKVHVPGDLVAEIV
jgi:hypothetical protein